MSETVNEPSGGQQEAIVYIGTKPVMTYVFEVISQFSSGLKEVRIKARGNSIAHAVDVAEVARRHKMVEGKLQLKNVGIGTERLVNRAGRETNVSTIEITLARTGEMRLDSASTAAQ